MKKEGNRGRGWKDGPRGVVGSEGNWILFTKMIPQSNATPEILLTLPK